MHGFVCQLKTRMRIGASDLDAVMALWDGGGCSSSELARRIVLTRAAITTLSDRLVAAGLVERRRDPDDRRRSLLVVTPEVEAQLDWAARELQSDIATWAETDGWTDVAPVLLQLHRHFTDCAESIMERPQPYSAPPGLDPRR